MDLVVSAKIFTTVMSLYDVTSAFCQSMTQKVHYLKRTKDGFSIVGASAFSGKEHKDIERALSPRALFGPRDKRPTGRGDSPNCYSPNKERAETNDVVSFQAKRLCNNMSSNN